MRYSPERAAPRHGDLSLRRRLERRLVERRARSTTRRHPRRRSASPCRHPRSASGDDALAVCELHPGAHRVAEASAVWEREVGARRLTAGDVHLARRERQLERVERRYADLDEIASGRQRVGVKVPTSVGAHRDRCAARGLELNERDPRGAGRACREPLGDGALETAGGLTLRRERGATERNRGDGHDERVAHAIRVSGAISDRSQHAGCRNCMQVAH